VRAKASDNATSAAENRSATRSSRATRRRSRTAAAFDVLHWLEVTNNGVLDVVFDPAPRGSNYIDVWDWFIHAQNSSLCDLLTIRETTKLPGKSTSSSFEKTL
jgi:hypothetical protein